MNQGYEEGQPCIVCGSDRISILLTQQVVVERNCKTEKLIRKGKIGHSAAVFWQYKCRKCGWISESFTEQ